MRHPTRVGSVSWESLPRVGSSGLSSLSVCGKDSAWRSCRGGGARCDPSDAQVSTPSWFECSRRVRAPLSLPSGGGFIHARWVVDRTLSLTSGDMSGMVDSYDRLSSMRSERSIVVRPDGVAQRRNAPSLMNAFQHGFGFRGG
ncbi:hypothetical protein GW17_00060522 [Ensete ventricosum]|nr:hypothetical protein GW17_00060522 [Ensete ventricosum]